MKARSIILNKLGQETFLNGDWHSKIIGWLVSALMVTTYLWILVGFFVLLKQLVDSSLTMRWNHGAEILIKNMVIILAALELIRTLQSYLTLGRVRVTFILDAALVVLIGELISLWYRKYQIYEVVVAISVIAILIALRIATNRYSPDSGPDR